MKNLLNFLLVLFFYLAEPTVILANAKGCDTTIAFNYNCILQGDSTPKTISKFINSWPISFECFENLPLIITNFDLNSSFGKNLISYYLYCVSTDKESIVSLIKIASNLNWKSDWLNFFRNEIVIYGENFPTTLKYSLNQITKAEKISFTKFILGVYPKKFIATHGIFVKQILIPNKCMPKTK